MSNQQVRQSELFAGEDWTVLYRAFTQINFNSYDPASINAALRDYIQTNYPEDYNDWIESSEFVAIIDLLSWLAGSLAFRTDVNARENFLETAQAKESVLRLARFLSYTPRRAQSARGLLKITEVKTTEGVQDSFGVNLNNTPITWNDPDNTDWFEQFTIVLNAAMPTTNPFGIPLKSGTISSTNVQLYRINNQSNPTCVYKFDAIVDGSNERFELVNLDITDGDGFSERAPDPANAFHYVYRNDGKGNASGRTGFFMFFKQGSLNQNLYNIEVPIENRLLNIDTSNISETDVWVQTLTDTSDVSSQWTKVPAVFGENITFTDIAPDIRDIFQVVTRDNDQIAIRFGDGRFGNVPVGNIKVWFRTVNGLQYSIRPSDMSNVTIDIPYVDVTGRKQTLSLRLALQENISNAVSSEDIEQVRRRAPMVYGAQNRMVSGEDYNVFPLTSNEIVKLRAVNRVYSGHSRFLDINDPTTTFQDTVIVADDGIIYQEPVTQYTQVPASANLTSEQIVTLKIAPMLQATSLRDFMISTFMGLSNLNFPVNFVSFAWMPSSSSSFDTKGTIQMSIPSTTPDSGQSNSMIQDINTNLLPGSMLKFLLPDGTFNWCSVIDVQVQDSLHINVTVTDMVPQGAMVVKMLPSYRNQMTAQPVLERLDENNTPTSELGQIEYYLANKLPFSTYYCYGGNSHLQYGGTVLSGQWITQSTTDPIPPNSVQIIDGQYLGGQFWAIQILQGLRYVFESDTAVRWHDVSGDKVIDSQTGMDQRDSITVLWRATQPSDRDPNTGEYLMFRPVVFDIVDNIYDVDGYVDSRKVVISPTDSDGDGSQDNPEAFTCVVPNSASSIVVEIDPTTVFQTQTPRMDIPIADFGALIPGLNSGDYYWANGLGILTYGANQVPSDAANFLLRNDALGDLKFQWKHYAGTDVRIDPAPTNIIDILVLTSEYDYLIRQWVAEGCDPSSTPDAPSPLDLTNTFSDFDSYKMFSDEIVWRPVKYKFLFGSSALPELQAQFKVVKLSNSSLSDGEIRSKVIQVINDYFDVNKWEFGETFYWSELSAYLHIQLATAIASVVIVPLESNGVFGDLFEVRCATDEMFISTAQVSDVVLIDSNTTANLRIKQ